MINKPEFQNNCDNIASHFGVYSIKEASALWCNIKKIDLKSVVDQMEAIAETSVGRSIYRHPFIACVEPVSRAIATAMESGALPHGREDGIPLSEYVAYERRHTRGTDLKKWIINEGLNEKPSFLFDDLERDTHTSISAESFRTLQADRDALKVRIENSIVEYKKLQGINKELTKKTLDYENVSDTKKRNLNLLIGLMTTALADKSGANCGDREKPNYSGLAELLQAYIPADGKGMPTDKSLSYENIRKKLASAYKYLEEK